MLADLPRYYVMQSDVPLQLSLLAQVPPTICISCALRWTTNVFRCLSSLSRFPFSLSKSLDLSSAWHSALGTNQMVWITCLMISTTTWGTILPDLQWIISRKQFSLSCIKICSAIKLMQIVGIDSVGSLQTNLIQGKMGSFSYGIWRYSGGF